MYFDSFLTQRSFVRVVKLVFSAAISALLIRSFIAEGIYPASGSMEPTLLKDKHYILEKVTIKFIPPKRSDIIVFPSPVQKNHDLIKRVIAVCGDNIEIRRKKVFLNNVPLEENYVQYTRPNELLKGDDLGPLAVPNGKVFVMGDNRDESGDSRDWKDPVTKESIYFIDNKNVKGRIIRF
ncbi:MAG: signal peptidase I [Elusimicrobia bacterium]|nr:signal peptidase I [Candidatus Liberimonas magnetica]